MRLRLLAAACVGLVLTPCSLAGIRAITGGTVIDGNGGKPLKNAVVIVRDARITAVGSHRAVDIPEAAEIIDARGKFIIPGMMDANVHLVYDISPEFMLRFEDRFEDIIKEGTQVALKNGFTTLFDTWGPLDQLKSVRDQIDRGEAVGSRLYVAGNIVGIDGPLTLDFQHDPVRGLSRKTIERFNRMWQQGVGKQLVYMSVDEIRERIRAYIAEDIDFLKIGISAHGAGVYGYLSFSDAALAVMVEEARRAGIPVQTHTMTADALRMAAEGDYDLAQHCGTTYRQLPDDAGSLQLLPDEIIRLVVDRKLHCTLNAYTRREIQRRISDSEELVDIDSPLSVPSGPDRERSANVLSGHQNEQRLISAGATILLSTDAGVPWIDSSAIHRTSPCWKTPDDCLHLLGSGHMAWLKAMHEMDMTPMRMLQAATRNIAAAYDMLDEIGTIEPGKIADLVILDGDPLADFNNYRKIHRVLKEGVVVDLESLPVDRVLTPLNAPHQAGLGR